MVVGVDTGTFSPARGPEPIIALLARHIGKGGHPLDRSDEIDEVGDVIGPDIEDRPCARPEEEIRIRDARLPCPCS